jgi:hypothetical protein
MIAVLLCSASTIAGAGESLDSSPVGIERRPPTRTGSICNIQYNQRPTQEFKTLDGAVDSSAGAGQVVDALYQEIMRQPAPQSIASRYGYRGYGR